MGVATNSLHPFFEIAPRFTFVKSLEIIRAAEILLRHMAKEKHEASLAVAWPRGVWGTITPNFRQDGAEDVFEIDETIGVGRGK